MKPPFEISTTPLRTRSLSFTVGGILALVLILLGPPIHANADVIQADVNATLTDGGSLFGSFTYDSSSLEVSSIQVMQVNDPSIQGYTMGPELSYYQAAQWGQIYQGSYWEPGFSSEKNYEALFGGEVHNSGFYYDWIETGVTIYFTPNSYVPGSISDSEIEGQVSVSFWSGNEGTVTVPISSGWISGYVVPEPSTSALLMSAAMLTWLSRRSRGYKGVAP